MATIVKLPCELQHRIFCYLPDLRTAQSFASSHPVLWNIWVKDDKHIIRKILGLDVRAYDRALDLAIAAGTSSFSRSPRLSATLRLWGPEIIRNTELCNRACALYREFCIEEAYQKYELQRAARAYYMLRTLVLVYRYKHLRGTVYEALETADGDEIDAYWHFDEWWICNMEQKEDRVEPLEEEDEDGPFPPSEFPLPAFEYADDILCLSQKGAEWYDGLPVGTQRIAHWNEQVGNREWWPEIRQRLELLRQQHGLPDWRPS